MAGSLEDNMGIILSSLYEEPRDSRGFAQTDGNALQKMTDLAPDEINDAVSLLVEYDYAKWLQHSGTAPFDFGHVEITPVGRLEIERAKKEDNTEDIKPHSVSKPLTPIGSPYGFQDEDWEFVSYRKAEKNKLYVVLGYQFKSDKYDSEKLMANIKKNFELAVESYNKLPDAVKVELEFRPLAAGYGEHLFNEIARDIISADIAIFDTSDLNPNVMVEMGVALTWGVGVLPIKHQDCPKPPSDISGQTWADYKNSAAAFSDIEHDQKLMRMVERAARKKAKKYSN